MLRLTHWPINFFGLPCYPAWEVTEDTFVGGRNTLLTEDHKFAEAMVSQWKCAETCSHENLGKFGFSDLKIARNGAHLGRIFLICGPNIVGEYGQRGLTIIEEYRKQHLSIVLILAKATVLNGPPNLDRRYTTAGRKAVSRAHRWICETHHHFTSSQEAASKA